MTEVYVTMLSCSECRSRHADGGDGCDCWCHDGDIDNDPYDGDDDPRCTHCNGEAWVECDDPIQCTYPRCDGELHPDPACGGTGLYEHQVIF